LNYREIISKAAEITFKHRVLWVFGLILSFFGGGFRVRTPITPEKLSRILLNLDSQLTPNLLILVLIGLFIFALIGIVAVFTSTGAIIFITKKVAREEKTSFILALEDGLKHWFSLLAIAMLIWIPFLFFSFLLAAILMIPPIYFAFSGERLLGLSLLIIAAILLLLLLLPTAVILYIGNIIAYRFCVIREVGVFRSISQTVELVRNNLAKTIVFWLILFGLSLLVLIGIGIIYGLLGLPVFLLTVKDFFTSLLLEMPAIISAFIAYAFLEIFLSVAWTLFFFKLELEGDFVGESEIGI
jgi:hypothetical protein